MITASTQDGTYPRPQLVRERHLPLDVACGFTYDDDDRGSREGWHSRDDVFDQTIKLPFAPESPDSGIGDTGYHPVVWYRIPVPSLGDAGFPEQGERVLLHFGAVDYSADVWVNGTHVTHHEGGQTPFSADITHALSGDGEQVIVVRAEDDPLDVSIRAASRTGSRSLTPSGTTGPRASGERYGSRRCRSCTSAMCRGSRASRRDPWESRLS